MRRVQRSGDAVFRMYGWSSPTLSLGRNQRARDAYDEAAAQEMGVDFVRRPTGGRALLHDHEFTYSVTMPAADAGAAAAAYDFINEVLLGGLGRLGVPARRAAATQSTVPGIRPCFDVPSEHEIVVNDRKLVGSAQWRRAGALLQHGSILVRDDQALISRLMTSPSEPPPRAGTLGETLGREPSEDEMSNVLHAALEEAMSCSITQISYDAALLADCSELQTMYEAAEWTWRR